ncbi:MAG: hypothetical protein ACRESZ_09455, partial [Methylococcales bacterium]
VLGDIDENRKHTCFASVVGVTSNQRGNSHEWSYTSIQRAVLRSHPRVVQPGQAVAHNFETKKGVYFSYIF